MAHPDGCGWNRYFAAGVEYLRTLVAAGSRKASGPLKGAASRSGFLVFFAAIPAEVEAIVAQDPFAIEGLSVSLSIVEWDLVFSAFAPGSSGELTAFSPVS